MKRVLMLLENEFPHDDRVEKEAVSLIKKGYAVLLLCPNFSAKRKHEVYKGIDIYRFSLDRNLFKKLLGLIQIIPLYKYLWQIRAGRIIKKHKIDIVHIHDLPLCSLIKYLKRNKGIKVIADMHENYPAMVRGQEHIKRFPNRFLISVSKWYKLEKKWLKNADLIICTASGMIKRLRNGIGDHVPFSLVPNTIDVEEFTGSQKSDPQIEKRFKEDFLILSYGVVSEQRGIQYVMKAISRLKYEIPEIKFLILGDGSYLKNLKDQAELLKMEDAVVFEGWQSQARLGSYMKNTDVCIIPHIKSEHTDNTSPNKLFHFMYFEKPVVASNCNYILEIVEEENCGKIYAYDDHLDMSAKILELYKDKKSRRQMGKNGRNAILKRYNWETTVLSMLREYEKLLHE
ncbi:MAG: glycosyltransferase family 4 protein [Cytophagales bacterium]|nr:glycosyltransferase family 4 protein [Cytophagales bacterium]